MQPPFGSDPRRLWRPFYSDFIYPDVGVGAVMVSSNLTIGYNGIVKQLSEAASLLGRRSAKARRNKWGEREFIRRMREWGKLGGRPKGSSKKLGR